MEDWKEFSAKTADEALTNALIQLETSSDQIEYEVIEVKKVAYLVYSVSRLVFVFVKKSR